jgi:hypothetical protein
MSELPNVQQVDVITVEGFDPLFSTTPAQQSPQPFQPPCATATEGWLSLKDACKFYDLKPTALRLRIKSGEIIGTKIQGPNGPEWRISPARVVKPSHQPSATAAPPLQTSDVSGFLDMIQSLQNKLEGASYRNGYLEKQVQEHEERIKLLTDSLHRRRSWWQKFKDWIMGGWHTNGKKED